MGQMALNYIRARTCLQFVQSSVATNRIRVVSGSGCYSSVGMVGGEQILSLGDGCELIGIVAHEFMHAIDVWHMQMRDDRDNYVGIDLSSVPANYHGNFVKLNPDAVINYNPYEYGSTMHYDATAPTQEGIKHREFCISCRAYKFDVGGAKPSDEREMAWRPAALPSAPTPQGATPLFSLPQ
ncbi:astacin [Ancylostoma duodenale]|uniref:Metalloendopeptidase n=1 Tax=Ancylostoma duodenale TaxID=51022 RepID=A0A0C2FY62_9BILA|nr:astacin [Ancylostoma duodenale]